MPEYKCMHERNKKKYNPKNKMPAQVTIAAGNSGEKHQSLVEEMFHI